MPIVLKDYRPLVISKMQIELNNKSRKDEISEKENRFEMMGQKIISPEGTKYQIAEDEILSDELGIGKNPEGMTYVTPLGLLIFFIISALGCPPHCGASTQSLLYVALSGLDLSGWKRNYPAFVLEETPRFQRSGNLTPGSEKENRFEMMKGWIFSPAVLLGAPLQRGKSFRFSS